MSARDEKASAAGVTGTEGRNEKAGKFGELSMEDLHTLERCRRQSHRWTNNSCYADAPLCLWEYLNRRVLHSRCLEPDSPPPLPLPESIQRDAYLAPKGRRLRRQGARPQLQVSAEPAEALRAWWMARQRLFLANEAPEDLRVDELMLHRDSYRLAYEKQGVTASSEGQLQSKLSDAMETFGSASSVLLWLLHPARAHFLRVGRLNQCPVCSWRGPELLAHSPCVTLSEGQLLATGGRPFLALAAKLAEESPAVSVKS